MPHPVIRYGYEADSLADIPPNEFESRLFDEFKRLYPGCIVNIVQGELVTWGELADGSPIDRDELKRIGNDVFNDCCNSPA